MPAPPDTGYMQSSPHTIWIPKAYQSQFGLLGAMADEILEALTALGYDARPIDLTKDTPPTEGVFFFFNSPQSVDQLPPALFDPGSTLRAVQYHVDHPFALPDGVLDEWTRRVGLERYRLFLPCLDDVHLLRPRFPGLVHAWAAHGIPRSSLCDLESIEAEREFEVVVTGSVRGTEEIERGLASLGAQVGGMVREIARMMIEHPWMGFLGATDLVMGSAKVITGNWAMQKHVWALATAMVNRERRIETVKSLQGLRVGVFGSAQWEEVCSGTITYAGEVGYSECAAAFARGRVGLAWGPTQFVHSYSERIMQAMAGGCCVVADDRLLVRRDFPGVARFDWGDPAGARSAVDAQLSTPAQSLEMGKRGRAFVEGSCLWEHRVGEVFEGVERVGCLR